MSPRHLDSSSGPGLSLGGYFCPQCHGKYSELPVECKVCGMSDGTIQSVCVCLCRILCSVFKSTFRSSPQKHHNIEWFMCDMSSPRFDSGVGPSSCQILPPPVSPPSLYREYCGGASRRQVALIHLYTPTHTKTGPPLYIYTTDFM